MRGPRLAPLHDLTPSLARLDGSPRSNLAEFRSANSQPLSERLRVWQFSNSHLAFCKGAAFVERLVGKQIAFSVRCDHHATAVAARTRSEGSGGLQ